MSQLEVALEYLLNYGFSVVPWKKNKRGSLIETYKEYQGRLPTKEEVREWWTKWPDAMIGVVTGPVSDIIALDFDWYKLKKEESAKLKELVPETIQCPIAISPEGGHHKLFRYPENGTVLNSVAGIMKGFDIRALKGVITMPPSINEAGLAYRWMGGRALHEVPLGYLNKQVLNNIITRVQGKSVREPDVMHSHYNNPYQSITNHNIILDHGKRDETIFHIVNSCHKGGMKPENIYKLAEIICKNCNPPFPENEIPAKIKSAMDRSNDREKNLTEEIKKFISITNGVFNVTEASQTITYHNKGSIRAILHRMANAKNPIIEPVKSKGDGWFRRVENDEVELDFKNAKGNFLDIKWPFQIERFVKTAPKNVIVVAGEPDAGKTAFLLNFAAMNNWNSMGISYFSSEMGEFELRTRLQNFEKPTIDGWRMKVYERASNFADVIRPDGINIIDFLELHDEFYKVGLYIREIFDKLRTGIAIIAIQKNPGKEQGLGGMRSIEKARLAINMERGGRTFIEKAKNWATMNNPRGLAITYKLMGGCKFKIVEDWKYADGVRSIVEEPKNYNQTWQNQY
jgi:hypothetical protein